MKRYFFFCTNLNHWVSSAEKLKELGLAEPSLWIGDDKLLNEAQTAFSKEIVFSFNQLRYKTARATKSEFLLEKSFFTIINLRNQLKIVIAEKIG